jgi:methylated-DNA-[protein]-cysteine S-methyltransferase
VPSSTLSLDEADVAFAMRSGDKWRAMAKPVHYHLFETAAGVAAIGWNDSGVSSLRLPATSAREAERSLIRRFPDAVASEPPLPVRAVIDAVISYFEGEAVDFRATSLDMGEQEPFFERVYAFVRKLGWGETTTYGAVAKALGAGPEFARDVGQAMANNPIPLIVPCHRVTGAGGKIGGFSAPGGSTSKAQMLALEGVSIEAAPAPKKITARKNEAQAGFDF